jgi:hypothetical protein
VFSVGCCGGACWLRRSFMMRVNRTRLPLHALGSRGSCCDTLGLPFDPFRGPPACASLPTLASLCARRLGQPTAPATGSLQRPVRPPALNCDRLSATPSFEMAAAADADASTVSVRFVSRLPEPVDIPESAFAVPEGLTRKGLAEVINGLLQLDPPQPFDFLINEEFLRCSLATFLKNRHVRRAFTRAAPPVHTRPQLGLGCSINNIRSATMALAIASTWR